jgi:cell division protein FtsQ
MASSSGRKSGSSGRSTKRKKIVVGPPHSDRGARGRAQADPAPSRARGENASGGRRAAEARRNERERRLRSRRLRVQLRLALVGVLVAGLVTAAIALYRSDLFSVRSVEIVGAVELSEDVVRSIAALPEGSTLIRFPGAEMKDRLEADPWIASATVSRDFPETIRIRIEERVPYALVDSGQAPLWIVDREGYVLSEQTAETTAALVVIRDIEGLEPLPGARSTSEVLVNALAVYEGLSPELRERTRAISAASIDRTALITTDDIEIFVGSAEGISSKDAVARQILAEQAGNVASINVRSVERPTWRGLDEP